MGSNTMTIPWATVAQSSSVRFTLLWILVWQYQAWTAFLLFSTMSVVSLSPTLLLEISASCFQSAVVAFAGLSSVVQIVRSHGAPAVRRSAVCAVAMLSAVHGWFYDVERPMLWPIICPALSVTLWLGVQICIRRWRSGLPSTISSVWDGRLQ